MKLMPEKLFIVRVGSTTKKLERKLITSFSKMNMTNIKSLGATLYCATKNQIVTQYMNII